MGDDDRRKADYWFHRNRQLDWKDRQAATQRELEILRLRQRPSASTGSETDHRPATSVSERTDPAPDLLSAHREILQRIRDARIDRWRSDKWLARLEQINPLQREMASEVQAVASDIEAFLRSTTDWELGRRSLGIGMVTRDDLDLTRSLLVSLSIEMASYSPSR